MITAASLLPPGNSRVTSVLPIRRRVPVEDYLVRQKRYAHLFTPQRDEVTLNRLQAMADRNLRRYGIQEEAQI